LSLFTQVYKMGTGNILLRVTLPWTSIASGGNWVRIHKATRTLS